MSRKAPRRRVLMRATIAAALLVLTAALTVVVRVGLWVSLPYRGYGGSAALVEIPTGATPRQALRVLEEHGIVRRFPLGTATLRLFGRGSGLKAGEYNFSGPMTPLEVMDRIISGEVYFHRITVLEGLRSDEIFALFARAGFGREADYREPFRDTSLIRDLDDQAVDLEGYLFPDTYSLQKGARPEAIIAMMVSRFREVMGTAWVQAAPAVQLNVRQAVTMASLIERETARDDEDPLVSSVFHNRLHLGMKLQCDPTVIFALAMRNQYDGNLRHDDLKIDSLYNTYRYRGLTPGPIGNPGAAALRSAVEPARTDYLYFVSMNNGRHAFSKSLAEHNKAVWEYQKKPFQVRSVASRQPS